MFTALLLFFTMLYKSVILIEAQTNAMSLLLVALCSSLHLIDWLW